MITNDDGIHAEGLKVLKETLEKRWEVVVVAPDREMSAAGHSLTLNRPLRVQNLGEKIMSVDGTPVDCVLLAVMKVLERKPDVVVSGINNGSNLGIDVIYSGTVAAAVEGAIRGLPSLAVSIAGKGSTITFEGAAGVTEDLIEEILERGLPNGTLLNVNVPNISPTEYKGKKLTYLGRQTYDDVIIEKTDPRDRPYYWIGGQISHWEEGLDLDYKAVEDEIISISPMHLDLTAYEYAEELASWNIFQ